MHEWMDGTKSIRHFNKEIGIFSEIKDLCMIPITKDYVQKETGYVNYLMSGTPNFLSACPLCDFVE